MALLAALAVAVAVVGASTLLYLVVQQQLVDQIDGTLVDAATGSRRFGPRPGERPFPPFGNQPGPTLSGRSDVFAQVIDPSRSVVRSDGQGVPGLATSDAAAVAAGRHEPYFFETTVGASHLRVYVAPLGPGQAVELARPLDEVDRVLGETRGRLVAIAAGGILLAAALGTLVSRATLAPVARLTRLVEEVTRTGDLSRRVAGSAPDELGRLAASFNAMLAALESSVRSQRQLVADASHELRTPLTSLRTNLELLLRGQPADPEDRRQLLADLVGQMERLSTLVADLIDLARDEQAALPAEDVRVDELVAGAIEEMRARYPRVRFDARTAALTVHGVRSQLARAVTNLLDNAGKWSPPGGVVEVVVADGAVAVRDHGPGVAPEDRERVFDRFWRSASARQLPGSGLGLSIVRDIAQSHGGAVTLEQPTGGGALFRLRFDS